MIGFCLKCSKDLTGMRRGTKFCSKSCRAGNWQKAKREVAKQVQPVRLDEEHLAELVVEGKQIIITLQGQFDHPFGDVDEWKTKLGEWCRLMSNHPILQTGKGKR